MAVYTTIDDPSAHFQTDIFTTPGGASSTTFDGNSDMQPDFVWAKQRNSGSNGHELWDSTRGVSSTLFCQATEAEDTTSGRISSFNSDGFSWGTGGNLNTAGNFVSWGWKANGGTTSSFTESGNNPGGTYQANTTAGFSVVTYTGTGGAGTVSHGLGAAPERLIIKNRSAADAWAVYYGDNTDYLVLNTTGATQDSVDWWNDTSPTSTVFTVGTNHSVNADGENYVAYVFAPIQGFSKFGSYVGNGSTTNGPFVYLGFKPAFVMIKSIDTAKNWVMLDDKRDGYNGGAQYLIANDTNAEGETPSSGGHIDFLSNGFKIWDNWTLTNQSTVNYIYMAWAENPFVSSTGIPTTAR